MVRPFLRFFLFGISVCVAAAANAASSVTLSLDKFLNAPKSAIGDTTEVALDLQVSGDPASNVTVSYTPPAGMSFVASYVVRTFGDSSQPLNQTCTTPAVGAAGPVTCTFPSLATTIVQLSIDVHVPSNVAPGTLLTHEATVTTPSDPSTNGKHLTFTTIAGIAPPIEMTSTFPSSFVAGAPFTWTIRFRNSGNLPADDLAIFDEIGGLLKAAVQTAGKPAECMRDPSVFRCNLSLLPGESAAFALTAKEDPESASFPDQETLSVSHLDFFVVKSITDSGIATALTDLAVTATAPPEAPAGVDFKVRIAVTAPGPSAAHNTTLTIPIPAGTTFVKLDPLPNGCTTPSAGGSGTITCTFPSIVPPFADESSTGSEIKTDLHLIAATAGSVTTTATIATPGDSNPANDSSSSTTTIGSAAVADLALAMGSPTVTGLGNVDITFRVTVTNNGPSTATNVVISDPLPAGATANGCTSVCTASTASLASGAFFTTTFTFHMPSTAAPFTNTATVAATERDPVPANNSASAQGVPSGIAFTASVSLADVYGNPQPLPSAVPPGASLLYVIDMTLSGGAPLTVTLPAGSVITSPANGNGVTISGTTLSYGFVPPGHIVIAATAPTAPGSYAATISFGATNVSGSLPFNVVAGAQLPAAADLAVLVEAPPLAPPGDVSIYVALVVNRGASAATNVRLTFTLPAHTTLDGIDAAGMTCDGSSTPIVCTASTLASGDTLAPAFRVRVADAVALGTPLVAAASVRSDTTELDVTNNAASAAAISGYPTRLAVRIDPASLGVAPGGQYTETITVTNTGRGTATAIEAGDSLNHRAMSVVSQSAPGARCSGQTVDCSIPSLAPGAQIVITAVIKVPQQTGTIVHTAFAEAFAPDLGLQHFGSTQVVVVSQHPWHRAVGR